jgi:glycosyltransferase involved in cell wall biosynthesis
MSKRRVLFVVPSLRRAGAENQVVQLVNGLPNDKFEKHLLYYLPDDELQASVDAEHVSIHHFIRSRKVDFKVARAIAALIDRENIEVVHCTLENALLYAVIAKRLASSKPLLICAMHTTRHKGWKQRLANTLLYRHLLKLCGRVWFVSKTQQDLWIRRMPFLENYATVVHNGIDCVEFDPSRFRKAGLQLRAEHGIPAAARVICCVAGFRPEKLHEVLIRSIRDFEELSNEDCFLLLAGSGPLQSDLESLARELGIENRVVFLGEVSDVRLVLAASDCKVLASEAETFSMAMLEAMAMELPVIATRVGGSAEAITEGRTGFLITPGSATELVSKLAELFSDEVQRIAMGRRARETVVEHFAHSRMIAESAAQLLVALRKINR